LTELIPPGSRCPTKKSCILKAQYAFNFALQPHHHEIFNVPATMKIKALSRSISSHNPEGSSVPKAPRNLNPEIHPFERAREYTRALNATKLERMFAAPFVAQLGEGHVDGVYTIAKDPESLERFASGSGDGV
jgi:hypothetical protein